MKRALNFVVGLALAVPGVFMLLGGFLRFVNALTAMGDKRLEGDAAGNAMGQVLLGLAVVIVGYALGNHGFKRLKLAFRGEAAPAPAPAADPPVSVPMPAAGPAPVPPAAPKDAASEVTPTLVLSHGNQVAHLAKAGGDAVIGRGSDAVLKVASQYVSRAHARIEWTTAGLPVLTNLAPAGTSVLKDDEQQPRRCEPSLLLHGTGTIALFADHADAAARGDVLRYEVR